MLNRIIIHGRITQDIELKTTQSGVSVCNFNVAVDRQYSQGDDKITDFFTVVCWRGLAELVAKHFRKGKEIVVSGSMQSRKWVDDSGNNRYSWEILADSVDFCGSKSNDTTTTQNATQDENTANNDTFQEMPTDDDLPF